MCSKCFKDTQSANTLQAPKPVATVEPTPMPMEIASETTVPAQQASAASEEVETAPLVVESASANVEMIGSNTEQQDTKMAVEEDTKVSGVSQPEVAVTTPEPPEEPKETKLVQKNRKRCFQCNKKVGFTGIECRCGFVYCSQHRYPDSHSCTYDFKTHDRANLAERVVGGGAFSKIDHL